MSILKLSTNNCITNIMIIDLDIIIILDMICLNVDWLVLLQFKSIGYYCYQYWWYSYRLKEDEIKTILSIL